MKKQNAFTLVELAIVMTIVGLLIGGVLKGQELLENSRMTAVANDIKAYQAALTTFRDIYKGMPGDHINATNIIKGCIAGNNCANGDGDGVIDSAAGHDAIWYAGFDASEPFQAWKHLALAELIKGVNTTVARPASFQAGIHVPLSPLGGMVYIKSASGTPGTMGEGQGVYTTISGDGTGIWSTPAAIFTVATVMKMDLKMDDGIAFSGDLLAVSSGWTSGCGTTANGVSGYNVNASGRVCGFGVQISR